ncbi:hypothetical protein MLD38_009660 [Melastoma candidum]|uniref:Uncharacterized protein n=1 Tax=Melastoma candidum TaxID=119954 RepID=A0ACB9RXP3_9MYRT|nr:hypothetical protein MLD38_009660 [Melastoma candidum]
MENDQPLTTPQLSTPPEDSETKNNRKSIATSEDKVSVVGSSSTSGNNQARNYECIFCKRGFANAQALGGHMNIHRKDKEKLKHQHHGTSSIDQTARLMDMVIPRMIQHRPRAPQPPPVVSWGGWMIKEEGTKDELKGREDEDRSASESGEVMKLPLFAIQPSNKMDQESVQNLIGDRQDPAPKSSSNYEDEDKGKSSSEGPGSLEVASVDLELRLGPEPQEPPSQPLSTRKFF